MKHLLIVFLTLSPLSALGQSPLSGVDMTLPKMTQAQMTRADVVARLAAATADAPADFTRVWLNNLDLSGLDFSNAILRATSLNGANLSGSTLDGAILSQSWMIGANLSGASLVGAELFQTQLSQADLSDTDFTNARTAADFTKANLNRAVFKGADFSADMRNQSRGLMRGVLSSARGSDVDFTDAKMSRADLEFANGSDPYQHLTDNPDRRGAIVKVTWPRKLIDAQKGDTPVPSGSNTRIQV